MFVVFPRMIPPAGTRISLADLFYAWSGALRPGDDRRELTREICRTMSVKYAFPINTGRAALAIILKVLTNLYDGNEVIIPGYTCFSVPSAIKRAGLKVRVVDFRPDSLDYDPEQLQAAIGDKTLAVLAVYPFCTAIDINLIRKIARQHNVPLIEDAAQSMGLTMNGQRAGTIADVGFYSLSKGKTITSVKGGIIVTNDDRIANLIKTEVNSLPRPSLLDSLKILIAATAMKIMIYPYLYAIITKLPLISLGETTYNPGFAICPMSGAAARLALCMVRRLDPINNARARNAMIYNLELEKCNNVTILTGDNEDAALYLRFPILVSDNQVRDRLFNELQHAGVSRMYHTPVEAIIDRNLFSENQPNCSNARRVANCLLTLPTHEFIREHDIQQLSSTLIQLIEARRLKPMAKVKVLQVVEDYRGIGGAETVVLDLLQQHDRNRFEQHAAVIGEPRDDTLFAQSGVPITFLTRPSGFSVKLVYQLRKLIKHKRIDVAHSHLMRMNTHTAVAARLAGIPGIGLIHGIMEEELTPIGRIYTRLAAAFNRKTVVVSETVRKQYVTTYGVKEAKTMTIYNAFDESRIACLPSRATLEGFRSEYVCPEGKPTLAAIGNIREVKGYRYLIDAVEQLRASYPDIRLLIAGNDVHVDADALRTQITELGLEDQVKFLGVYTDIATLLAVADIYVNSSLHEGFSLTTVEAMAGGLPVVATRCGGPEDIVIDGQTGLLTPVADSTALARALRQLLDDSEAAEQMGRAGKKRAFDVFSMANFIEKYQELYCKLAGITS